MFYKIVEFGKSRIPYGRFLELLWAEDCAWPRYGVCKGAIPPTKRAAEFFLEAEVVREKSVKLAKGDTEETILLLRWNKGRIFRSEEFHREKGEQSWRWFPDPYNSDRPIQDLSTPRNAYLFVEQCTNLRVLDDLCVAYATEVKGGLADKEWIRILNDRLSRLRPDEIQGAWDQPQMTSLRKNIEEEMQPVQAGSTREKCKVWRLRHGTRERLFFETFVKERDQWKWLPKPDYWFLYPSKIESSELQRRMKTAEPQSPK
jgi:hypothetical protein